MVLRPLHHRQRTQTNYRKGERIMATVTRTSEEILPEDRVTNALIERANGKCAVEVPYNNYGERGYVDLVANWGSRTWIMEIKSKPKSANSVLRQYNKMKANFVEGTDYQDFLPEKGFALIFTASQKSLEHLKNNKNMYQSLPEAETLMADEKGTLAKVFIDGELNFNSHGLSELEGINEQGPLACPYCGKEYKMEGYYRKHVEQCNYDLEVTRVDN